MTPQPDWLDKQAYPLWPAGRRFSLQHVLYVGVARLCRLFQPLAFPIGTVFRIS